MWIRERERERERERSVNSNLGLLLLRGLCLRYRETLICVLLRRRRNGQSRSSRYRFFFHSDNNNVLDQQRGLEPSIIQSLPVVIYHPNEFKDGLECAVCLCEFSQGEKARILPRCNHGFHLNCIDMWFQSHSTCPLCRTLVELESGEIQAPKVIREDGSSAESRKEDGSSSSSAAAAAAASLEGNGKLVIDIPRQLTPSFSFSSASSVQFSEEELKSPTANRMRSLKRLLSRGVVACSPTGVDVEQGTMIQCPKAPSDS
ncbi:RING-H2 finger protein ATL3 [Cinnamomum micranthum f. kanehirae]|uniref:RING-type E3 ubiquitin transferase n=1 Tax=Cinnamomum micranthum f. kanehirae TaxID=337451 RepID=A0A3S3MGV1_9MAGN|nr:RING-H2 finger protein ATL3 [Cinnamomum micranthum f. kanehirae]